MTSFRPIRAQHSLTAPQSPEVTPPEVPARPEVAPQTPEVTARPEVTPGSDRATGSESPDSRK